MSTKQNPLNPAVPVETPARRQEPQIAKLKAERVQLLEKLAATRQKLAARLEAMPDWAVFDDAVGCVRVFPSPPAAAAYAGYVVQAASHAGQSVVLELAGSGVLIVVRGTPRHGLTEEALAFAQALG